MDKIFFWSFDRHNLLRRRPRRCWRKAVYFSAGCAVFYLLIAGCWLLVTAALTGGGRTISALSTASGGGRAASGPLVVSAANIGGLTASGTRMAGGNYSVTAGATPAVVTFSAAKSDLSAAHCYPVPFKPSAGHTKITFTGLTSSARIRIYTISGELVRALEKADASDSLDWDVRNARGAAAASGVYLYLVESSGRPKKGKLMVIR